MHSVEERKRTKQLVAGMRDDQQRRLKDDGESVSVVLYTDANNQNFTSEEERGARRMDSKVCVFLSM